MNEEDEIMIEMWNEGISATLIGSHVGRTRNAVIGRLFRLRKQGLILRNNGPQHKPPKKKIINRKKTKEEIKEAVIQKRLRNEEAKQKKHGKIVTDLGPNHCRYVIGEPNGIQTRYCSDTIYKRSYCAEHHALCYYTPGPINLKRKKPRNVTAQTSSWRN